jgi:predicted nucleic acid-binding protein
MPFVIDNSVVAAWHLNGQQTAYTDAVFDLLAEDTAHVPALWRLEFSNVVRKALALKKITEARAWQILETQEALPLRVHDDPTSLIENFALAQRYGLSSYDAAYLELALRLNLPIATKDNALHEAAMAAGVGVVQIGAEQ